MELSRTQSPLAGPDSGNLLSAANHDFLIQYIHRESGIALGNDKLYLLKTRLLPLVERERLHSLDELVNRLRKGPTESLRRQVIECMTTHETLFFRDATVFAMLRNQLLPGLAAARKAAKTLRIWCAACSSGQEPYSIAMLLHELGYADWNLQILGTDLSSQILERAAAGRYLQIEVNRGLPAAMLVKYFRREGLEWQIKDEVRRRVRFAPMDLRHNIRGMGPYDLILCRNVLIYFDMETRRKIIAGLQASLVPGGYLLLGASETTFNLDDTLTRKTVGASIVYQKPGGNA